MLRLRDDREGQGLWVVVGGFQRNLCGALERAARLGGAVEALLEITRGLDPDEHLLHGRTVATLRTQLDPAILAARWAEGRAMTLEQAIAYALAGDQSYPAEPRDR